MSVGRTGSGKVHTSLFSALCDKIYSHDRLQSSLTLSLLRCIFTEGNVYYDGIPTNKINLDALRTSITIIPQMVRIDVS